MNWISSVQWSYSQSGFISSGIYVVKATGWERWDHILLQGIRGHSRCQGVGLWVQGDVCSRVSQRKIGGKSPNVGKHYPLLSLSSTRWLGNKLKLSDVFKETMWSCHTPLSVWSNLLGCYSAVQVRKGLGWTKGGSEEGLRWKLSVIDLRSNIFFVIKTEF